MTRKYTKTDIENLLFIQKLLRQDHLTIKQVEEYCMEKGFNSESGLVDSSNPLAVQTFISAMTVEFDKRVTEMQNSIIKQQQEMIDKLQQTIIDNNESLKQELSLTVDEVVTEKMNDFSENFTKELSVTQELNSKMDNLKELMEQRKKESEEQFQPKSLISKLFHKKK